MFKILEYRITRLVVEILVFINKKEEFNLDLSLDFRKQRVITIPR
jgi:hypothetical protein